MQPALAGAALTVPKIKPPACSRWSVDFEVGAELKTKAKTKIARAAVGYSFVKTDQVELGAGVGLHYLDWETTLKGNATINGEPVISAKRKAAVDGWAPNLALFGGYAFGSQWLLGGADRLDLRRHWLHQWNSLEGRRVGDLPAVRARRFRRRLRLAQRQYRFQARW